MATASEKVRLAFSEVRDAVRPIIERHSAEATAKALAVCAEAMLESFGYEEETKDAVRDFAKEVGTEVARDAIEAAARKRQAS